MLTAMEITKAEFVATPILRLKTKPVFAQGIQQKWLYETTMPVDVKINGVILRLPAGCCMSIIAGGTGGYQGSLKSDVEFLALNGERYRATAGMALFVPNLEKNLEVSVASPIHSISKSARG